MSGCLQFMCVVDFCRSRCSGSGRWSWRLHIIRTLDPVVVLADRLIVQAMVDETDLSLVEVGQRVDIRLDAYPDEHSPATVNHIAYESRLVNNVSVYPVDIVSDEVPVTFRSGMTATLTFIIADKQDVLLIPSEAIAEWPLGYPRPDGASLAVYRRGMGRRPMPVAIRIGESDGRMTELLEGLKEGDDIVIVRRRESDRSKSPFSPRRRPQEGNR